VEAEAEKQVSFTDRLPRTNRDDGQVQYKSRFVVRLKLWNKVRLLLATKNGRKIASP
jgi:hypothetical protein